MIPGVGWLAFTEDLNLQVCILQKHLAAVSTSVCLYGPFTLTLEHFEICFIIEVSFLKLDLSTDPFTISF